MSKMHQNTFGWGAYAQWVATSKGKGGKGREKSGKKRRGRKARGRGKGEEGRGRMTCISHYV